MHKKKTISNLLILVSVISTILAFITPEIYQFWINDFFISKGLFYIYVLQLFIWNFLHGSVFHILTNGIFLYFFWNIIEVIIWRKRFILFFLFIVMFNGIIVTYLSSWNTIWISGFCMALIAYYTLELKSKNNPEYKWWITAIIINVWIWLLPGISLIWHLFWAIWWIIFYYLNKNFLKKKYIWNYYTSEL